MTLSHSSGSMFSTVAVGPEMPALLTSTSRPPNACAHSASHRTPKIISPVNAVGQQAANFSEETKWVNGRETIASRQRCDLYAIGIHEAIRHHDYATVWFACLCGNDGFELGRVLNRCGDRLHSEG